MAKPLWRRDFRVWHQDSVGDYYGMGIVRLLLPPGRAAQPLPSLGTSSGSRSGDPKTFLALGNGFSSGADNNLIVWNLFLVRSVNNATRRSARPTTEELLRFPFGTGSVPTLSLQPASLRTLQGGRTALMPVQPKAVLRTSSIAAFRHPGARHGDLGFSKPGRNCIRR